VTREIYGTKVVVIPLLFYKARIRFKPFDDGGGILCQAPDGKNGVGDPGGLCLKCPLRLFGAKGEPPECDEFLNYASLVVGKNDVVDLSSIAVVSMKSTAIKMARDWNSLIKFRNTDIFAGMYELSSASVSKGTQQWYTPVIKNSGWVSEKAYSVAKIAHEAMTAIRAEGRLRVDVEDLREPGDESPETGGM